MPSTQLILDDLIQRLRQNPCRADDHIVLDLQQYHSHSPAAARSILVRARFVLDREATRRHSIRRQCPKSLPGETIGTLDNAVRVLEDRNAD
jgi:hypothetical protein